MSGSLCGVAILQHWGQFYIQCLTILLATRQKLATLLDLIIIA